MKLNELTEKQREEQITNAIKQIKGNKEIKG